MRRRPSGRRALAAALAGAALVAAVTWYLGADAWHAILLGVVLATVGSILTDLDRHADVLDAGWQDGERHTRLGARADISDLARSLRGRRGHVGEAAVSHVARIAERRLAARRLDLRDPSDRRAIEQLIGRRPYAVLAGRHRGRPSLRTLVRCLDALDGLR